MRQNRATHVSLLTYLSSTSGGTQEDRFVCTECDRIEFTLDPVQRLCTSECFASPGRKFVDRNQVTRSNRFRLRGWDVDLLVTFPRTFERPFGKLALLV